MKQFVIILLSCLYPAVYAADPYPNNHGIDVVHYRFYIELNDTTNILDATAEITVLFTRPAAKPVFDLVGVSPDGYGMTVHNVFYRDTSVPFTHENNMLTLNTNAQVGERRTYRIHYTGIPADGLVIAKNKFGDRTFFGDNWPNRARHWLCCVDHPSDKARCEFVITAPEHYQVIGNGIRIEQTNLPRQRIRTHWKTEAQLPTKIMVIGASRFAVSLAGDSYAIPVTTWVYPQNSIEGFSDFSIAVKVLDYFQSHIAPYPYRKLANVQSKTRYGGMENASAIFYAENAVNGKNEQETLIAHEIAHQWFGNSVSELDWSHVWLSEGFATYFTNLYMEHAYGFDRLKTRMREQRQNVIDYYRKGNNHPIVDTIVTDINDMLNPNSYQKGGWVLHMLRHELGDVNFWKSIREYYHIYQGGNTRTRDLQTVMENVSGKTLQRFFDQWLRGSGHPVLSTSWKHDAKAKKVTITVSQTQSVPFVIPLEIGIRETGGTIAVHRIALSNKTDTFSIPCSKQPLEILLDPDVWLLFDHKTTN